MALWAFAFASARCSGGSGSGDLLESDREVKPVPTRNAPRSLAFSILHSIWIDDVRSRRVRIGQGFVEASTALVLDGEHDVEIRTLASQVLRKVDALPEAQRTAVFLAYVEGFSYQEVAEPLNIPIGTVMSRLASARARLAGEENMPATAKSRKGGIDA